MRKISKICNFWPRGPQKVKSIITLLFSQMFLSTICNLPEPSMMMVNSVFVYILVDTFLQFAISMILLHFASRSKDGIVTAGKHQTVGFVTENSMIFSNIIRSLRTPNFSYETALFCVLSTLRGVYAYSRFPNFASEIRPSQIWRRYAQALTSF